MQDRSQNFSERARQSDAAKLANLEAFRAGLTVQTRDPFISEPVPTLNPPEVVNKPLLSRVPRALRYPVLAATAGAAVLGAAACTSGNGTEVPQAPTNQGEVLGGAHVTPVPSASTESGQSKQAEQIKKAPDFTLNDKNGNPVSLHDFAGRPLIIEYSEPACSPCKFESSKLNDIKNNFAKEGLSVLTVSTESDDATGSTSPVLVDSNFKFANLYTPGGAPVAYFVDRAGNLVYEHNGFKQGSNDLDLLAAAFMAGKDLNNVLPTPTPQPTETSTPVITKENLPSDEAVFDLGNFALGITGWEELTNVQPYQVGLAEGKKVDVKTVVIHGIVRNITNSIQEFKQFSPNSFEPTAGINFVDSAGKNLEYYPGLAKVLPQFVVPLSYSGVFDEPFEKGLDGSINRIDGLYRPPSSFPTELYAVPGFGLPVEIVASVPINTREYGIAIAQSGQESGQRKIVMKGQVADGFKTIEDSASIGSPGDVFGGEIIKGGHYQFTFKSMETVQYSLGTEKNYVANFHFIDEPQSEFALPYLGVRGQLYLEDGRVLRIDFTSGLLHPGQEGDVQAFAGGLNPDSMFPLIDHQTLMDAYNLDLQNSTVVLIAGQTWKAWKVQEGN